MPNQNPILRSEIFFKSLTDISNSMAFFSIFIVFLYFSFSDAAEYLPPSQPPDASTLSPIRQACKATRYPHSCQESLIGSAKVPSGATGLQLIQAAMSVATADLDAALSMVVDILAAAGGNVNLSTAATNCVEILHLSEHRLDRSETDFLPLGRVKDARAWTTAAISYEYGCWCALKRENSTANVIRAAAFLNDALINHTSNALSMMAAYDRHGENTDAWGPPETERQGSFEAAGTNIEFAAGIEEEMKADVTVCLGGGCDYGRIQQAVDAAPDNDATGRFVILIKEGTYEEIVRVPLQKQNLLFLGEGMGKTVITGSLHAGLPGISTYNSATVGVQGDGFMAKGITFQNAADPDTETYQAVAFRSDSDHCLIQECEFLGNQDTVYAHALRQFYKSCQIQGNVDFIFGNSASVFHNCLILVTPRQISPEKGETNVVAAHGRIDPAQSSGFVFQNCIINGTEEYMRLYNSNPEVHLNYLGRPWKEYSRVVFIHCKLGALVSSQGWMPWTGDMGLKTLYFGEFENYGPGSNKGARVDWSSIILGEHIASYSLKNFIQGDQWIPS